MTSLPGLRVAFATIAILGIAVAPALAQDASGWPTRPIRLVVGFGAGGGTDIAARLVAEPLAEILARRWWENRPGAGGMTAADAVAKSPKDGYTAMMMSNAHAISAVMYKTLRYDPVNDFQMVSMVATAGLVLVTRPDFPGKDVAGVLAVVRASPGKLNFGSAGVGTTQQFAGELMKQTAGLNVTHVPYRTTPAAVTGFARGTWSTCSSWCNRFRARFRPATSRRSRSPRRNETPFCPMSRPSRNWACRITTSPAGTGSPFRRLPRPRSCRRRTMRCKSCSRARPWASGSRGWARAFAAPPPRSSRLISRARS